MDDAPTGIYLFLGPDRARKLQRIQAIERCLQVTVFDRHQLDATSLSASELVMLCRQSPASAKARLIVVDQAHRLDRQALDGLVDHASAIGKTACVILLVENDFGTRHPLAEAQRHLTVEPFPAREVASVKPFALIEALGRADTACALRVLHEPMVMRKEPLEWVGLVAWQLQRWVLVKRLLEAGYRSDRIGIITGLQPWQLERLKSECSRYSLSLLHRWLKLCWQLDTDAKSGRIPPEQAIEQLLMEVCLEQS